MTERRRRTPSPALVVSVIALVVAGTGTGIAATQFITGKQVKDNSLTGRDIKDGSIAKKDLAKSVGTIGPQGAAGPAGRSALEPLRSGESVRGVWAVAGVPGAFSTDFVGITLPVPAPVQIDSKHANFAGNDSTAGDGCTGTAAAPVSAPGFVCLYFAHASGTTSALASGALSDLTEQVGDGSTSGFTIFVAGTANFTANGTWVYTAP